MPAAVAPTAATSTSRQQAEPAVDEDDGRRQRLRSRGLRRVGDADHVAADVAGQEIIEELRDQERLEQPPDGDVDVLRLEENPPPPRRGEDVDEEDDQRDRQPPQRGAARDLPEVADVDAREQQREQHDADGDFCRHQHVTTHERNGLGIRGLGFGIRFDLRVTNPESRVPSAGGHWHRKTRHFTTFSWENHPTVRILMIAPEPFFEPRGTPFSEFHRIRALTALGHEVDLVTYPFGQDVAMTGIARVPQPASTVRARREDRSVVREAAARRAAHADGDPARAVGPIRRDSLA